MSFDMQRNFKTIALRCNSPRQELDIWNRSFSLPDCSENTSQLRDGEPNVCSNSFSVPTSPKSFCSLYRSISYERCYIKEGNSIKKSPLVCKMQQSFVQYNSTGNWKKEHMTATFKYDEEPSFMSDVNDTDSKRLMYIENDKINNSMKCLDFCKKIVATDWHKFMFFVIIPLIVLSVGIVTFCALSVNSIREVCERELDLTEIEISLSENIFGQDLALKYFLGDLREIFLSSETELSVVVFAGGTGVGKSYLVSLFSYLYPVEWTVQYFNAQIDMIDAVSTAAVLQEAVTKLTSCGMNLVIIDNAFELMLSPTRSDGSDFIKKIYFSLQNERKKALLILVVNYDKGQNLIPDEQRASHETVHRLKKLLLSISKVRSYFVEFMPLSQINIAKCIQKALENDKINLPLEDIYEFIDIYSSKYFRNGCKGINNFIYQLSNREHSLRKI